MFSKFIVGVGGFFCATFGLVSAESNAGYFEISSDQNMVYSVDPGRLFMESGRLYFDSETGGPIPLRSISYSDDGCYASFSTTIAGEVGIGVCSSHTVPVFGFKNIDINNYGSRVSQPPKKWQCPYCHLWWSFGEPCMNKECATNRW